MKYDIFISYRREGGYETAKHLNDLLVRDGYKVSFDIDTLRNGDFDTQLLSRIEECKDFILIVDKHTFDRTLDPSFDKNKDWLRCELAHALKHGKNIIPVFLSGVSSFPDGLPSDIVAVIKKNGPEFNKYYFDDFYKKLKSRFLKSRNRRLLLISIMLLLLLGGVMLFVLNASIESEFVVYQNPSMPHTTDKEQFDDFVLKSIKDLTSDTSDIIINFSQLLEYWEPRAEKGDVEAQFNTGLLYYNNQNPQADLGKAIKYFSLSAQQKYPQALYSLAVCYDNAIYVEQDLHKATDLYYNAAIQNYAPAQNDYPIAFSNTSKVQMSSYDVFEWYEKSAKQGYAPAQYHLALCYSNNRDIDSFYYWLKKSADQNYTIARYNLAVFYLSAENEYSNIDLGVDILKELVKEEFPYAYYNLALCYGNGIVVDKDINKGFELIKEGAKRNDPVCIYALGMNYFNPQQGTVSPDYKKGLELLYQAADFGYPLAQYYIGIVYQQGLGVTKDLKKAQKWFDVAAQQGATHQTVQSMNK